jgi:hypothetical protein
MASEVRCPKCKTRLAGSPGNIYNCPGGSCQARLRIPVPNQQDTSLGDEDAHPTPPAGWSSRLALLDPRRLPTWAVVVLVAGGLIWAGFALGLIQRGAAFIWENYGGYIVLATLLALVARWLFNRRPGPEVDYRCLALTTRSTRCNNDAVHEYDGYCGIHKWQGRGDATTWTYDTH